MAIDLVTLWPHIKLLSSVTVTVKEEIVKLIILTSNIRGELKNSLFTLLLLDKNRYPLKKIINILLSILDHR